MQNFKLQDHLVALMATTMVSTTKTMVDLIKLKSASDGESNGRRKDLIGDLPAAIPVGTKGTSKGIQHPKDEMRGVLCLILNKYKYNLCRFTLQVPPSGNLPHRNQVHHGEES